MVGGAYTVTSLRANQGDGKERVTFRDVNRLMKAKEKGCRSSDVIAGQ